MFRITADTPVEEVIRRSDRLNGASRLVNSFVFPLQDETRTNPRIWMPAEHLGLKRKSLRFKEIEEAITAHGAAPANLSELLRHALGHWESLKPWDLYTEVFALGQIGRESTYGNTKEYVPFLWGAGSNHQVQTQSKDAIWSPYDRFLVVQPQEVQ